MNHNCFQTRKTDSTELGPQREGGPGTDGLSAWKECLDCKAKRRLKQIPRSHWRENTNWDSGRWRQPEWEAACSKSRSYSKKGLQKSRKRSLGLWLNNNLHVQGKAEIPLVKNSKEKNITGELQTEQLPEFTQGWITLQFPPIKAKRPHGTHRTFRRDYTGPCLKKGVNLV